MKFNELLESARKDINQIDIEMLKLLVKRVEAVKTVTEAKKREGREIFSPDRELALLRYIEKEARKLHLDLEMVRDVYRSIIESSKRDQHKALRNLVRIGFLNPRGSFCEKAARYQRVKDKFLTYVPYDEVSDVFGALESKKIEVGVLPYQTSFEIGGDATVDHLLQSENLKIIGETLLPLDIALISPKKLPNLKNIKTVYGSSWLITRLKKMLDKSLKNVEYREIYSNDFYIEAIQNMEPKAVALAPIEFAELNKLHIAHVFKAKQTGLISRYAVVSRIGTESCGNDMTTLAVELPNKNGCLHKFTGLFAEANVSILNINLVYLRRQLSEHVFILDISGHQKDESVKNVIKKVSKFAIELKVLGSYPVHYKAGSAPNFLPSIDSDL